MVKKQSTKYIITSIAILTLICTTKVQAATGKVTTETLNLRSEPSTSSSVLDLLNADEELEIISEEGNWYKVKYENQQGYVSKEYVKVEAGEEISTTTTNTTTTTENSTISQNTEIDENTTIKLDKDVTIKILPLINANNLGTAKSGEEVTVITTANNWIFIQTDEIAGWIVKDTTIGHAIQNNNEDENANKTDEPEDTNEENVEVDDNENNDENSNGSTNGNTSNETNYSENVTKYVNTSSVYVRSEPSTSASIVTTLIKNTDVKVLGESGDWYKIKFNDYSGYIRKDLLSDSKIQETNRSSSSRETVTTAVSYETMSNGTGTEIVNYAKQFLGCPYVYGAAGSSSFDCSGFTMYVYKHFGISLSHSATAQSKLGEYVSKENLLMGDLVFFLDYETMDGIGHCGIYIGNGEFIHASSGSGYCVKTSTLLSGSYYNRYATARRLI